MLKLHIIAWTLFISNPLMAREHIDYIIPPTNVTTEFEFERLAQDCNSTGMARFDVLFVQEPRFGNVQSLINQWINQINGYYRDSKIYVTLKSVGIYSRAFQSKNMPDKLRELKTAQDIQDMRNRKKADFVLGIVDRGTTSGIAGMGYIGISPEYAFSVVNGTVGPMVVAHELGHNMGLGHSVLQNSKGSPYPWGRGHGVPKKFATIMSYAHLYPAPRVKKFSSPKTKCNGLPCGIGGETAKSANSAKAINCVRFRVSRHR